MADELQQYLGKFAITDSLKDFTVEDTGGGGAQAVELTTGDYYLESYTAEGTNQLLEHMQAQIRALGGVWADAVCSYSGSTGFVTLNFPSTTSTTVVWTDTGLGELLGWTAGLSAAKSYTATLHPRYVWRPSLGLARYPTSLTSWWGEESTSKTSRSADGTTRPVGGTTLYGGSFAYALLPEEDMIITSDTDHYEPLQHFWRDVIAVPMPIRCYPDRTKKTASDVFEALWATEGREVIGRFEDHISRRRNTWNGLWNFDFELWKYVVAS